MKRPKPKGKRPTRPGPSVLDRVGSDRAYGPREAPVSPPPRRTFGKQRKP